MFLYAFALQFSFTGTKGHNPAPHLTSVLDFLNAKINTAIKQNLVRHCSRRVEVIIADNKWGTGMLCSESTYKCHGQVSTYIWPYIVHGTSSSSNRNRFLINTFLIYLYWQFIVLSENMSTVTKIS